MRALLLATTLLVAAPAAALQRPVSSFLELGGRPLALTQQEQDCLLELGRTRTMSRSFQSRALAAAERAVRTPDARYLLAIYQLELSGQWGDDALRRRALDTLIATPRVPPEKLADYLAMRGGAAYRAGDHAASAADLARVLELRPGDGQTMMNLAQARIGLGDGAGAVSLIRRAIAGRSAAAGPVPEVWYRQWLSIAFNAREREQGTAAALALVEAYPTAENWRLALSLYRQLAEPQGGAEIELLRLIQSVGAMTRADEYQRFSQLLLQAGLADEARAVLEGGVASGVVPRDQPPTPEILREIARAAQGRGQRRAFEPDPAALALRAAAGHASAGRQAQAVAVFRLIVDAPATEAGGGYGDIARFWLAWLTRSR
jgi:tetratricopeptide (TPR) repeat protein